MGFTRSEEKTDFKFILSCFFKYNDIKICKIVIVDENRG